MPTTPSSKYRPEIDGLRAFAVVAVIINHFNKDLLPSGYLGVDIFFVISGYVITSSLAGRESKNFLDFLTGFYERRIKRLVPALVVFVLITSVLICLFNPEPGDALSLGWKSLFGVSNIILYRSSTDYFAQSTELNPFTHTWSLGVEEQFYLLFPFLIWFSGFGQQTAKGARNLFFWVGALTIASLVGFIYLYKFNQPAAYFLMPTRFWEMAAGCLIFIGFLKRARIEQALEQIPPLLVVAAMVGVMFLPVSAAVPATISIVVLSAVLIACLKKGTAAYQFFTLEKVVFIGLISYSLYLWHWGVLCISRWTVGIHWWSVPFQLLTILILSICTYHYVETPTRRRNLSIYGATFTICANSLTLFSSSLLLVGLSKTVQNINFFTLLWGGGADPEDWGKFLDCHGSKDIATLPEPFDYCLKKKRNSSTDRRLYLVGDSHAAQFYFMANKALFQTRYKLAFINTQRQDDFPRSFWQKTQAVQSSPTIIEILGNVKKGDIVAIAFHRGHLNKDRDRHVLLEKKEDAIEKKRAIALINFEQLVMSLRQKHASVILIRDIPLLKTDDVPISTCQWQQGVMKWNMCDVSEEQDDRTRKAQDSLFDHLKKRYPPIHVWDPRSLMGRDDGLYSYANSNGIITMSDQHHITRNFSLLLAPDFAKFLNKIIEK